MIDKFRDSIFESILLVYQSAKQSLGLQEKFCALFGEDYEEIFSFYNIVEWINRPFEGLKHLKNFINECQYTRSALASGKEPDTPPTKEYDKASKWTDLTIIDPSHYVPVLVDILGTKYVTVPANIEISQCDAIKTLKGLIQ